MLNQLIDEVGPEDGLAYAREAFNLAKKEQYTSGQGTALSRLGSLHYKAGKTIDAIKS